MGYLCLLSVPSIGLRFREGNSREFAWCHLRSLSQPQSCICPETKFHWSKNLQMIYIFWNSLSVAGSGQGILLLVGSVSTCPVLPKNTWVHHAHTYSRCTINSLVRSSFTCLKLSHPITELDLVQHAMSLVKKNSQPRIPGCQRRFWCVGGGHDFWGNR